LKVLPVNHFSRNDSHSNLQPALLNLTCSQVSLEISSKSI
jgi:hypothetical protein